MSRVQVIIFHFRLSDSSVAERLVATWHRMSNDWNVNQIVFRGLFNSAKGRQPIALLPLLSRFCSSDSGFNSNLVKSSIYSLVSNVHNPLALTQRQNVTATTWKWSQPMKESDLRSKKLQSRVYFRFFCSTEFTTRTRQSFVVLPRLAFDEYIIDWYRNTYNMIYRSPLLLSSPRHKFLLGQVEASRILARCCTNSNFITCSICTERSC